MASIKFFITLLLLYTTFSLKLQLIDEDYVEVQIGYPSKTYRLIVDPVGPFTYIFNPAVLTSNSTESLNEKESFKNVFGEFSGEWREDFFYLTDDRLMNFRLQYLYVTQKKTRLTCDGVLGLGYSKNHLKGNLYDILGNMENVFKSEKVFSYNKKTMLITIGEIPERSNYNPTIYKIYEKPEQYPGIFLELSKLRFVTDYDETKYISEEDIKDDAMLTFVPVIIAPKKRLHNLYDNYTKILSKEDAKVLPKDENKTKFFTDFCLSKENVHWNYTEIVFDRMAYRFRPFDKKKDGKYRATIRFGNAVDNNFNYWYVGIDVIGVDRVDFNFEEQFVKLYSKPSYDITKSKPQLLRDVFVYIIVVCIFLGFGWRCFFQKKKQKDILPGEELIEL